MAMTAWSAKVLTSSIWAAVNGLRWCRPQPMAPMVTPWRTMGTPM